VRPFVSAVAAALLLAGTAAGATVHTARDTLTYTAGVGEQNVLTFDFDESDRMIVRDPGATIVATGECVSRDPHTAVCSFMPALEVELGDLNDSVVGPDLDLANVRGGEGNDTLCWAGSAASRAGRATTSSSGGVPKSIRWSADRAPTPFVVASAHWSRTGTGESVFA